jgi:hypothetical protein
MLARPFLFVFFLFTQEAMRFAALTQSKKFKAGGKPQRNLSGDKTPNLHA